MSDTVPRAEPSLTEFLSARARQSSDTRLLLDAALGLIVALTLAFWRPPGWSVVLSAALCFLAFGVWGITDRELRERVADSPGWTGTALRVARGAATTLGIVAGAALLLSLLRVALGTWIS